MRSRPSLAEPKNDAALAACLLAVDPSGLGGAVIRSAYGPEVEGFLKFLRGLLPAAAPFRRMPLQVADGRLLGGLDLAATLQAGRPVLERGLLADADGGCVVLPMAERLPLAVAARLCSVLDSKEVVVERDGFGCRLLCVGGFGATGVWMVLWARCSIYAVRRQWLRRLFAVEVRTGIPAEAAARVRHLPVWQRVASADSDEPLQALARRNTDHVVASVAAKQLLRFPD